MTSNETITVSKADYESLLQRNEDLEDLLAAIDADRTSGRVPHKVAVAIANGHSPITAFRAYKGISLRQLANRAGISAGYLSEIERGSKTGSVSALARIANELEITIDSLMVDDSGPTAEQAP